MSTQTTSNGHGDIDLVPVTQDHPTVGTSERTPDLAELYRRAATLSYVARDDVLRETISFYALIKKHESDPALKVAQATNVFLAEMNGRVAPKTRSEVKGLLNLWVEAMLATPENEHRSTILLWAELAENARNERGKPRTSYKG